MESFAYTGVWWTPASDQHVAGTLTYDAESYARLKLVGILHELTALNSGVQRYDVLLGVAGGKKLTLVGCVQVNTQISMPGIPTSELIAPVVLVGQHVEEKSAIQFDWMAATFDHFLDWAGVSAISIEQHDPNTADGKATSVTVSQLNHAPFAIGGTELGFSPSWKVVPDGLETVVVSQELALKVRPPSPLDLDGYLAEYFYHIQNFLTLGAGSPIGTRRMTGHLAGHDEHEGRVEIIFEGRKGAEKPLHRWDMLFTLRDLGNAWPSALEHWLSQAPVLGPVFDLFFSTVFGGETYLQHRFLSLAQALESYHRRTSPGQYLPAELFAEVRGSLENVILGNDRIPRDVKSALLARLLYFNELSQRRRLKDTLASLGDLCDLLISTPTTFVDDVISTRNYLTHFDAASERQAKSDHALWDLTEQLRFVLEMAFLLELGMPRANVSALAVRHRRYLQLRSALRQAARTSEDTRPAPAASDGTSTVV